ncbi:MAG TPA: ABC transporter substrate-binding protein [Candidatus Binatia bacterium]|nr:ABC transporter substrate-binding protein [Candidatus Binatia bacterium]
MKFGKFSVALSRIIVIVFTFAWGQTGGAQTMEKVRIGMPSLSLSFVAPQVAYAKGFFRDEGIDAELIRIATNVGLVAVTTKEIGYTTAVGAALRAGVKGLPIKIVTYFNGRPLHVLVAKREFKSVAELRGKIIGFAGYGDSTEFMLRAILSQAGLGLEKDVQAFQVSGSGQRLQALLSGKLDAAIVPPPFNFEAESKGFNRLMAAADVFETSVSGLALHNDTLRDKPAQVKKMLRALLKAQNFIRANKTDSVRVIADWLKLEPGIAQASYDIYVKGMSPNGIVSERVLESDIERARRDQQVKDAVPVARVVDFAIVREALQELGMR